jgi:hypothetical protein
LKLGVESSALHGGQQSKRAANSLVFRPLRYGTQLDVPPGMPTQHAYSVLPVLFVGANSALAAELEQHGLGVITVDRVDRALRLLQNFTVAAVIYDLPALQRTGEFTALGIPVVVLTAGDSEWGGSLVTVVRRGATAPAIAELIQGLPARQVGGGIASHAAS